MTRPSTPRRRLAGRPTIPGPGAVVTWPRSPTSGSTAYAETLLRLGARSRDAPPPARRALHDHRRAPRRGAARRARVPTWVWADARARCASPRPASVCALRAATCGVLERAARPPPRPLTRGVSSGAMTARTARTARRSARAMRGRAAQEAAALARAGRRPGLGVLLVGDDPASAVYVRSKTRACEELGLHHETARLPGVGHHGRGAGAGRALQPRAATSTASWCSCRCRRRSTPSACSRAWTRPRTWTASTPRTWACSCRSGRASWPARRRGSWSCCGATTSRARRPAGGGAGPQRHRGQAHGAAAAARRRHGHASATRARATWPRSPARPTCWWPPSAAPAWCAPST